VKIAILGVGGLGGALARGLLARGGVDLVLCDRNEAKVAVFKDRARIVAEPSQAAIEADVIVLAVKPKSTAALAQTVATHARPDALIVSCAAGIPLSALPNGIPVARAMPSIGAAVGASTTGVCLGAGCVRPRDTERLRGVFGAVGQVREVGDESWLHPVTAVGASGPAFLLLAVEALVDAGVEQGLPRQDALAFARGALLAAAARLEDGAEPAIVRAQVTSPAGTTAAGLGVLERAGTRAAFQDAVRAACERSRDLSKG
jgi:pyrroline-5-carboxylate reductase